MADVEEEEGVIYPPPEIKVVADKTAAFVARNGPGFEDRIREKEQHNHKFCFLNPNDPYFKYFQWKVKTCREEAAQEKQKDAPKATTKQIAPVHLIPMQPPPFDYMLDLPSISKQDYEIMKLTAQFVAINGPKFMSSLSQRELKNSQFDFLRPSHSLYLLFTKLVEQYQKILNPPRQIFNFLEINVLDRITKRLEFEAYVQGEKERVKQQRDEEQIAFATIDWHDFVVVETIEFHDEDDRAVLPAPLTVAELEAMTLQEKKSMLSFEKHEFQAQSTDIMQLENDHDMDVEPVVGPINPAPSTQPPIPSSQPPPPPSEPSAAPNIRTNYVPKFGRHAQEATQICPRCKASVKVSEMAEHMRVELLDPKWREQQAKIDAKQRESNLVQGDMIAENLKKMAEMQQSDVGLSRKAAFEAEKEKAVRDQKVIWDGHAGSANLAATKMQSKQQAVVEATVIISGPTKRPPPPSQPPMPAPPVMPVPPGLPFTPMPPPGIFMPPPGKPAPPPGPPRPPPPMVFKINQQPLPPPPPSGPPPPPSSAPPQNPAFPDQKRLKLNANALVLTIKMSDKSITFDDLTPLWTVSQLKERLVQWSGLTVGKQKLTSGGRVLKNSDSLLGCEPVLELGEKTRGGRK